MAKVGVIGAGSWGIALAKLPKIPVARIVEALENPGGAYQHNGMNRHFPDIRFIWWAGGANFTPVSYTHLE